MAEDKRLSYQSRNCYIYHIHLNINNLKLWSSWICNRYFWKLWFCHWTPDRTGLSTGRTRILADYCSFDRWYCRKRSCCLQLQRTLRNSKYYDCPRNDRNGGFSWCHWFWPGKCLCTYDILSVICTMHSNHCNDSSWVAKLEIHWFYPALSAVYCLDHKLYSLSYRKFVLCSCNGH